MQKNSHVYYFHLISMLILIAVLNRNNKMPCFCFIVPNFCRMLYIHLFTVKNYIVFKKYYINKEL